MGHRRKRNYCYDEDDFSQLKKKSDYFDKSHDYFYYNNFERNSYKRRTRKEKSPYETKYNLSRSSKSMCSCEDSSKYGRHNKYSKDKYRDSRKRNKSTEKESKRVKDDNDGHLAYRIGGTIQERYKILETIGEGTFGRVAKVIDFKRFKKVALKMIKNVDRYRKAAKYEISVLKKIQKWDPEGRHLCVQMLDWCDYYGHICIAFEVLGLSLFDFLKMNYYNPYPLDQVRHIAYQLCYAVKFLHDHHLSHTDLKPENILFVNSDFDTYYDENLKTNVKIVKCTDIKLIDFGSATFDYEYHSSVITTRHYRALEVILGLGWDENCDIWSIGCILFELFQGIALFQTHKDLEHLAMMEKTLGPIPFRLIKKSKGKFFINGLLDWNENSSQGKYVKKNCKSLFSYINYKDQEAGQLFNLISLMLKYDQHDRITLRSSLKHEFFDLLPKERRLYDQDVMERRYKKD